MVISLFQLKLMKVEARNNIYGFIKWHVIGLNLQNQKMNVIFRIITTLTAFEVDLKNPQ